MDEILYYLSFSHFLGIGPHRFSLLMNHYATIEKAYYAPVDELKKLMGDKTGEKFNQFRKDFNPQEKLRECQRKNITVVPFNSPQFPQQLKEIPDPPICLYVKGDIRGIDFKGNHFFGMVGTRMPSSYGQYISRKFSAELTRAGCIIVSGLALGVDAISHWATIDEGGKTIAFLGCGVDIIYPPANRELYERIVAGGGLVISEFPPGMTVMKGLFIARNRLISGLSAGIMIVEGLKNSGSLITAKYAAEQGKEVFAPPVPLNSQLSEAPNILLKNGAKLVMSLEDILEELQWGTTRNKKVDLVEGLNSEQQKIVQALMTEPLSADELAIIIKLSIQQALNSLSLLEIKGIVGKNSEGKFYCAS